MASTPVHDRTHTPAGQVRASVDMYTEPLTTEGFQRLFTRDTCDA